MTDEDNAEGVSSNISTQDWLKNKYPEAYRDEFFYRIHSYIITIKLWKDR